jgi:hypothetical protein
MRAKKGGKDLAADGRQPDMGFNHGEREDLGHWDKMYSIHSSRPLLLNVEVIVFSRLKMIALR